MFCSSCGKPNDERVATCASCGAALSPTGPPLVIQSQTCGYAITSLVLGVVSVVICCPFTGIPAILLGMVAVGRIRDSDGRLTGRRMAIAGIVLGVVGILLTLLLFGGFVFYRALASWQANPAPATPMPTPTPVPLR